MVASLAIPSCGRTGGWVVFRRSGATWRLVMERNNGADLDVVGTGIRETQFVLRPGDAHCSPTGGTRSRTWRWNGTRFVSSPWTRSKPAAPATPVAGASAFGFFQTPSRNILCGYSYNASKANVGCVVKSGLNPQPAPRHPGSSPPLTVALRTTGRAFVTDETCPGEDAPETPYVGSGIAKVLAYGTTWSGGGLRCTSAETGLTCRNKSGHGFFLTFSSFITPRIIKVLYVLATIGISLWTLLLIVAAFNVSDGAGGVMLLIGGPLFFLFSMIYARVFLELVIAFFRINGNVQEIRDERIGGAPQPAPSLGPPPEDAPVVAPPNRSPETDEAPVVTATAVAPSPEAAIARRRARPRPSPRPQRRRHATARTAARSADPKDASARAAARLDAWRPAGTAATKSRRRRGSAAPAGRRSRRPSSRLPARPGTSRRR